MEQSKKNLKIYSWLFIFLGAWDILTLFLNYLDGQFNIGKIATTAKISESLAQTGVIIVLVIAIAIALVKFYVGFKGLNQVNGKSKSKGYLTILKVILVFEIIYFVLSIISIFSGKFNWSDFFGTLATIVIVWDFLKTAKNLN